MKPDSFRSEDARSDVMSRRREVEKTRATTIRNVTAGVTQTVQGVKDIIELMQAAPAGTFTVEEEAYPLAILDDLSATVDGLSADLITAIAAARPAQE